MKTPLQATVWELWRTSRYQFLWVMSGQLAFVLLISSRNFFSTRISEDTAAPVLCGIFVFVATVTSSFSQSWRHSFESGVAGFSFRLGFTQPVSTWQLVSVPMLFIGLMAPICYVVPALFFQLVMGWSVPMLFPALLSACSVCALAAAAWVPTTSLGKAVGLVLFATGLIGGLAIFHSTRHHPDPLLMAIGKREYFTMAWYEYLILLAIPLLATAVTVAGVERQRHGDQWRVEEMAVWLCRRLMYPRSRSIARLRPFPSKFVAQSWYEMRRFGFRILTFGAVAPLLPLTALTYSSLAYPNGSQEPAFWLAAIGLFPLAYQMIGADAALGFRVKQGALQFSAFDATRALRNDQLIAIKLVLIAACSLLGWLWLVAVAAVHSWLFADWPHWQALGTRLAAFAAMLPGEISVYWWLSGALVLLFTYVTTTSMMLAFGLWTPLHPRFFGTLTALVFVHYLLAIWDFAHGWGLRYLWISYAWLGSAAILVLCILALVRALQSGFLGMRFFYATLCVWTLYLVAASVAFSEITIRLPACVTALLIASALIPLATTAIAPLALAAHRHG